jgi:hypothetical protein
MRQRLSIWLIVLGISSWIMSAGCSKGPSDSDDGDDPYPVWSIQTSSKWVRSICGNSGNNIYAVAGLNNASILHYDGSKWTEVWVRGSCDMWLSAIWVSSGGEVFAAGFGGGVVHFDGSQWMVMNGSYGGVEGIWGSSASDVYTVGLHGSITHYDGADWTVMTSGSSQGLRSIWGSSASDIFAVGDQGTILHYNGNSWSPMSSGTSLDLYGVWGSSGNDVFAVGWAGVILHFNGSAWSVMATGTTDQDLLTGVWGSGGTNVFATGPNGRTLRFDGTTWSAMTSTSTGGYCVWGTSDSNVFAGGVDDQGGPTIRHFGGGAWQVVWASDPDVWFRDVWGNAPDNVYAVGTTGYVGFSDNYCVIRRYDGSTWSTMQMGFSPSRDMSLQSVWSSSSNDAFAVGDHGMILHCTGVSCSPMTSGVSVDLWGVWGDSSNNVFAAGDTSESP